MEIAESARKHGITDEAIRHAWEFAIRARRLECDGEERLVVIGPDASGTLIELVAVPALVPDLVIHAQRLRKRYYDYL
ncbi:hypothetical protein EFK50_15995 [Nocardioides marmoriginsengisoli]|uniref:Toxin n=1 Tax=Nocardioides marmoriginsengisoli TaxID=661483 RepID=A0A3N0CIP0_9ACTN|nr:hypothetical protein [Nocardioides marmoriginsengisoli]RNL63199.1 hypothetical protein EFK50_15995 [Nocardioides marmoriginsengisoli]